MLIGPSLFPVIFAALAGRSVQSLAQWRAAKGVGLSRLWSLARSRTVLDTVSIPFVLGRATPLLLCALLWLLWALSPIGGQASLRLLTIGTVESQTASPVHLGYMDTGPVAHMYAAEITLLGNDIDAAIGNVPPALYEQYAAALLQAPGAKLAAQDAWGGVKIPRLSALDAKRAGVGG